uniref:Uncharacterized protein n=1 Tax=viral metagenome TaxID=1070528 RepID=A0A6M3IPK0_9ZZZZ
MTGFKDDLDMFQYCIRVVLYNESRIYTLGVCGKERKEQAKLRMEQMSTWLTASLREDQKACLGSIEK